MRTSLTVLLSMLAAGASGQTLTIGETTQVRAVSFQIEGSTGIDESALQDQVAVRGRGEMVGLRRAIGMVPFVPPVASRFFDPVELQRDKERLRRYFVRAGYPSARVDYDVRLDAENDLVDVRFLIQPGTPLVMRSIAVAWADSVPPTGLDRARAVEAVIARTEIREGQPLDERVVPQAAVALGRWLGEAGYAFATVRPDVSVDSAASEARVVLRAMVGPRTRLGRIDITGNTTLATSVVRRFLGLESGEWFSPARLEAASQRLASLDVVGAASFAVPRDQPIDTLVNVVLTVQEEPLRTVSGEVGYATDGGFGGEAQWSHRSIFGGAQALTASLSGQTGILALSETYERFVRGSLTFRQPIRGTTALTLHAGPFAEYRDDYRDRSVQVGLETTLLYQIGALSSVALRY